MGSCPTACGSLHIYASCCIHKPVPISFFAIVITSWDGESRQCSSKPSSSTFFLKHCLILCSRSALFGSSIKKQRRSSGTVVRIIIKIKIPPYCPSHACGKVGSVCCTDLLLDLFQLISNIEYFQIETMLHADVGEPRFQPVSIFGNLFASK